MARSPRDTNSLARSTSVPRCPGVVDSDDHPHKTVSRRPHCCSLEHTTTETLESLARLPSVPLAVTSNVSQSARRGAGIVLKVHLYFDQLTGLRSLAVHPYLSLEPSRMPGRRCSCGLSALSASSFAAVVHVLLSLGCARSMMTKLQTSVGYFMLFCFSSSGATLSV